jgi:uncharacterized protein YecT (DUF1311 family)
VFRKILLVSVASISLTACEFDTSLFSKADGCLDPSGQSTAIDAIKESIEKHIIASGENATDIVMPTGSKIRATLDQLKFSFEDVRTTKEDPNSTKKFCTSGLRVSFPEEILKDAAVIFSALDEQEIRKRAEKENVRKEANTLRFDADFNVQPTDDGEKIYAEVENAEPITNFIGDIVIAHLLRKPIERSTREQADREAAEQQQAERAEADKRDAIYAEAKATNDLALQGITASWNALPSEVRQRVLPLQRAWIKRKDAECKIEAANASIDPTEREAARLQCQARFNNARANEINQALNRTEYQSEETY